MTRSKQSPENVLSVPPTPFVVASFVFVDRLKNPIAGLGVAVRSKSLDIVGTTDDKGLALKLENAMRGEEIIVYVKRKDGVLTEKARVTPKLDINAYVIRSPELHLEGVTKLTPKELEEEVLAIPTIREGEVLTSARLFNELSPFIGSAEVVTEVGQVVKDFPTKKSVTSTDPESGARTTSISIEHHYRVVKTNAPRVVVMNLLGSRLNYPKSEDVSESAYAAFAKDFGCEVAAVKAVATTESGDGVGYLPNGLPKILFERHRFYALTDPNKSVKKGQKKSPHPYLAFPDICNPKGGGYMGGIAEYKKLMKAAKLDRDAAIMSCSWGAFQVLGEYHEICGFKSPSDLVDACMASADGHLALLRGFLKMTEKKPAAAALKERDWEKFTKYYNGGDWKRKNPDYPQRMKDNYSSFVSAGDDEKQ